MVINNASQIATAGLSGLNWIKPANITSAWVNAAGILSNKKVKEKEISYIRNEWDSRMAELNKVCQTY